MRYGCLHRAGINRLFPQGAGEHCFLTESDFDLTIAVNPKSGFLCTQAVRSRADRPTPRRDSLGRPLGPSASPVKTERRIADQYLGAAKERDAAINPGGYRGGTSQLGSDIVSHAILRIIKPAARPMARGARLQTPNDRETAEVPRP